MPTIPILDSVAEPLSLFARGRGPEGTTGAPLGGSRDGSNGSPPKGVMAGAIVGSIVGFAIIVWIIASIRRRWQSRKFKKLAKQREEEKQQNPHRKGSMEHLNRPRKPSRVYDGGMLNKPKESSVDERKDSGISEPEQQPQMETQATRNAGLGDRPKTAEQNDSTPREEGYSMVREAERAIAEGK